MPDYDQAAQLAAAKSDVANWMSYLPDDVFVAHVSIPGTHDAATAEGWSSSAIGASTYSTTQAKNLDYQLENGIRAFDFRPGLVDGELWCNHGIHQTKLKLADAFTKLTNYLDSHPGEFFVIHLFRGNVPNAGTNLTGGKNSDADREQYNTLINELFNTGSLAEYIVDYNPRLTVKDIRKHIVIFRRDRIEFAHIAKAGNLWNWPADNGTETENNRVTVNNASNAEIVGYLYATDISSPKDATALQNELNSLTGIFNNSSTQAKPNDVMQEKGTYKPDWYMPFTSGAYQNENTAGYKENATHTNPHFTNLLRDAQIAGKTGPCGTVFSDWVLVDTQDGKAVKGVDLVKAIYENNFYYIKDFILDTELFASLSEDPIENVFDETKWYYMRNVGAGEFLSGGFWSDTHACLKTTGIKVQPKVNTAENAYYFVTDRKNGTNPNVFGFKNDLYVDRPDVSAAELYKMVRVGENKFVFKDTDGKGLGAEVSTWCYGNNYFVGEYDFNQNDPMQQWELIECEQYYQNDLERLPLKDGIDLTYRMGHFCGNGPDNASWVVSNLGSDLKSKGIEGHTGISMLAFTNPAGASSTSWTVDKEITGLPEGMYTLSFNVALFGHKDITVTIGTSEGSNSYNYGEDNAVEQSTITDFLNSDSKLNGDKAYEAFRTGKCYHSYTVNVGADGKITFKAVENTNNHGEAAGTAFGDFKLVYFGDARAAVALQVQEAIDEVTAYVRALPEVAQKGFDADIAPYQAAVDNMTITGDGSTEIAEILALKRKYLYKNTTPNANFTDAITNPSFETGDLTGWTVGGYSSDTAVRTNTHPYTTDGIDGDYLFNTWWQGVPLTQIIPGLPAGHYRLDVDMASGDGEGKGIPYMFVLIDGTHSDAYPLSEINSRFQKISYEFNVGQKKDIEIGVVGGNADGTFNSNGHWWYKADNFRLTYLSKPDMTEFYNALQAAIDDATSKVNTLPEEYQAGWEEAMAPYQALITEETLEGDGSAEIAEIYALLQKFVLAQNVAGADMTYAILNNSFETGDLTGWTVSVAGDTGVKASAGNIYVDNCDGNYLFNTWDGDNKGYELSQTITGLHPGVYRIDALVTTNEGEQVQLYANDETVNVTAVTGGGHFENAAVEFVITKENSSVTFGARMVNRWYKADNFRMTLVAPYEEVAAEIKAVTSDSQLVEGATYYIVASHENNLHVMSADDRAYQALVGEGSQISHVAKAQAYTLTKSGSDFVLTVASAQSDDIELMAVSDSQLKVQLNGNNAATVVNESGDTLGFHPGERTFGFTNDHNVPANIYTAADNTQTGVDDIFTDNEGAGEAVYYNLQGVRVENPANGLYIKKQGSTVTKVLVK